MVRLTTPPDLGVVTNYYIKPNALSIKHTASVSLLEQLITGLLYRVIAHVPVCALCNSRRNQFVTGAMIRTHDTETEVLQQHGLQSEQRCLRMIEPLLLRREDTIWEKKQGENTYDACRDVAQGNDMLHALDRQSCMSHVSDTYQVSQSCSGCRLAHFPLY